MLHQRSSSGQLGIRPRYLRTTGGFLHFAAKYDKQFHTSIQVEFFATPAADLAALLGGSAQYISLSPNTQLQDYANNTASGLVSLMSTATKVARPSSPELLPERGLGTGIGALKNFANKTLGYSIDRWRCSAVLERGIR